MCRVFLSSLCFAFLLIPGCKTTSVPVSEVMEEAAPESSLGLCAAVRGNGHYLFSHFGALARIIEEYGVIDGMAGGSSASVTTFLYDSIRLNPSLEGYEGRELANRVALLFKSLMGYVETVASSDEGMALTGLVKLYQKIREQGILGLTPAETQEAAAKLKLLLEDPGVIGLVNPNVIAMLRNIDDLGFASYQYKIEEIKTAAAQIGAFDARDQRIFFREGILSFKGLAEVINRIANFYAGYGPFDKDAMDEFLSSCAPVSPGKTWSELSGVEVGGRTCGARFDAMVRDYRRKFREAGFVSDRNRLDDPLGGGKIMPIIVSSVVVGQEAVDSLRAAEQRYRRAQSPNLNLDFNAVRFGYWMPASRRASIEQRLQTLFAGDAKTERYYSLNEGNRSPTWRESLRFSAMEPGLSKVDIVSDDMAFTGGWSDLHPVPILEAAGCSRVIYVTRRGPETQFVTKARPLSEGEQRHGVAELLGMTPEQQQRLYLWDNPESSFSRSTERAGAVWCTDWDSAENLAFTWMFNHCYRSGVVVRDPFFEPAAEERRITEPIIGCVH